MAFPRAPGPERVTVDAPVVGARIAGGAQRAWNRRQQPERERAPLCLDETR